MSFTYDEPPATPRDRVRLLAADTIENEWSVSDEKIDYWLEAEPDGLGLDETEAAARVADTIAEWWALNPTKTGGSKSIGPFTVSGGRSGSDMAAAWRAKAAAIRGGGTGLPSIAGGMFTGNRTPTFSVGMMDNGGRRSRDSSVPWLR